jgi:hypothetical protein
MEYKVDNLFVVGLKLEQEEENMKASEALKIARNVFGNYIPVAYTYLLLFSL